MTNNKIKTIDSKKDAIVFLNQLIVLTDKRMRRMKDAIRDLEKEISKYGDDVKKVPTEVFNRHSERIESVSSYLLNLLGDETKTAVSYKQFRNIIDKRVRSGLEELKLDELEDEIVILLNDIRDMRNWSHHVPQSIFNSQIDYMKEVANIPGKLVEFQFSQPQVCVLTWEYHDINWFKELYSKSMDNYKMFSKVFQRMKKDYSKLIGESMTIIRESQKDPRPYSFNLIAANSFKINTRRKK